MVHVEEQALLEYALGLLAAPVAADVERHLAGCEACRARHQNISSDAFSKTAVGSSHDGAPPDDERGAGAAGALALTRGATLARYVVLEKLGSGGMGEVFAAYDPHLDRKVALKLLRGGALSAEEGKTRLLREAQAMARLQHPNVIAVHDVGLLNDRVFVAMEYVEGETLGDWLRGQRPWEDILRVFTLAGDGLAAAHRAGLVHRDFKPDNVLLGADGRPRVLDFGLARQAVTPASPAERSASLERVLDLRLTRDGAVMGTPGYMPPEQIDGLPTDARSDQFSFCVALFEGLLGSRPFAGATLAQLAAEIAAARIKPVPSSAEVPGWVVDVLKRGLAAKPADRWPDMDALLRALRPRQRRSPRRLLFAAGLALVSALGIGYGLWARQRLLVCGGAERALAGTWDPARKAKLAVGFEATRLSFAADAWARTERALDAWAAEYAAAAREVCEAGRVRKLDSPELTELKEVCLEERLQQLGSLVTLFERADAEVVKNAPLAARELPSATTCVSAARAHRRAGLDEQEAQADQALHQALADAQALFAGGKYAEAAQRLQAALSPSAPAATQAEAYLALARAEVRRGEHRAARQANLNASEQALKSGDAALTARAFSRLFANEGLDQAPADTEAWGRLATAAAARAPADWEVLVELAKDEGYVQLRKKNFKAALAEYERVLALQQRHLGPEHPDVAGTENNLGLALTLLGRYDDAVERYRESLRLHELLEGPEHPNVAAALHNQSVALRRLGRLEDSRGALERALEIRRKAFGPQHPETLGVAEGLVKVLISLDALLDARTVLEQLREGAEALHGADSKELLIVHELEAELLLAGRFWPEAAVAATEHLALARRLGAAGERDLSTALLEQATAWTATGSWAQARRALDEVKRRLDAGDTSVKPAELEEASGRLELAQGHAAPGLARLREALALRERDGAGSTPQALATLELALARALLEGGEAAEAQGLAERALQRVNARQASAFAVDAEVVKTQARYLSVPDGGAADELLTLWPRLSESRRPELGAWLARRGLVPDAGITP